MKKYELITELEVTPKKSKKLIDNFLLFFNEWEEYKDEFIGEEKIEILEDKNKWNESYLRKHISLLSTNFSKKRLEHIKEIIEYLYPNEIEEEQQEESTLKKKFIILGIILLIIISFILYQLQLIVDEAGQNQTVTVKDKNQIKK